MTVGTDRLATFLGRMGVFKGTLPTQIDLIAREIELVEFPAGEAIFIEGEVANAFYIIYSGRVQIARDKKKVGLGILIAGDYFGEEGLLFSQPRSATVTAIEDTVLMRLGKRSFMKLMNELPMVKLFLLATVESRRLARTKGIRWVERNENIYLMARRHPSFLLVSLIGPVMLGWVAVFTIFFGLTLPLPTMQFVFEMVGVMVLGGAFLWGLWNYLDWGNDYYIVTNQRVIWIERVLGLYDSRQEAPLGTVQAVNIHRDQLGRIFGYGDLIIRTFTGQIVMRSVAFPEQMAGLVEEQLLRMKQMSQKTETAALERVIRQRIGLPVPPEPPPPEPPRPARVRPEHGLWGMFESIRDVFRVRYEEKGTVTFRKHWIKLVEKAWAPSLLIFLVVLLMLARAFGQMEFISIEMLLLLSFTALLVLAAWWGYEYVDWINDIYQVTSDSIIDIYRKPFGDEVRKTALLENILSLENNRIGLIGLLLNYGTVTAAVGAVKFTFDGVYDPAAVQQEIYRFISARKRSLREAESNRERERLADWVAVYHEQVEAARRAENDAQNSPNSG